MATGTALLPPRAAAITWTLFSAVVGAGYATGQELVLFLGPCGRHGPAGALAVGMLIGLGSLLRSRPSTGRGPHPGLAWAGPVLLGVHLVYRGVALLLAWITLAAMVAAMADLLGKAPGQPAGLLAAAGATWVGAALPVHRGLGPISRTLGPLMALAIVTEAAVSGALPPARFPRQGAGLLSPSPARCVQGLFIYAAGNAVFAGLALERLIAETRPAVRQLVAGCAAGGLLTGIVAAAALLAIDAAGTAGQAMPLMAAALRLHPAAGSLHVVVVASAAYTTAVAAAHALASAAAASSGGQGAEPLWGGLVVASVLPAARGGFVESVQRLYPLGGWVALAALALGWVFATLGRRRLY